MKEGPMEEHIERGDDGVVKSLYITYRKKDGMLVKETTVRQFYDDNDYTDSYSTEPIIKLENTNE